MTKKSADWLKDQGASVQLVEQTIRYPSKTKPGRWEVFKRDAFGIADLIAVHPNHLATLYCQTTSGMNNKGSHQEKIEASPHTKTILQSGNRIELHVWRKMGKRGQRKLWVLARFQCLLHGDRIAWSEDNEVQVLPLLDSAPEAVEGDW